ncbi:hypothetical protein PGT21_003877 [Puccinia graminis f. sp. tritici]|uniref:BRCT domain-containing protein n=1 Tax=Puccinia graminis f. sp. tritici TaxID=56615 RepID=A0A5B0RXT7_PUCGR|nr:hypothetical protein PGT21_003877 [Puccinia graminis f. sp. tritici]KAA1130437.1 hypothetical protein PGTUg99_018746 [Puccinia graminis f. sp. tritici]
MDKFVIRKEKPTATNRRPGRAKSSYSKAASLTSLKATSTRVPQAPFLSSATSRANRLIDSTLADPSNPVTHNDSYRRAQHVVSAATGHQQSNGRSASSSSNYNTRRISKLRAQAKPAETNILKQVIVYINGYTGPEITNQALIGMIQSAGGETRPVLSGVCTHIVTAMALSAKKAQHELERKKAGPRIVQPQWVLDSIRLGKRQPEWKYPVQQSLTQDRISSVFEKAPKN